MVTKHLPQPEITKLVSQSEVANLAWKGHAGSETFNYVFAESEEVLRR